MISFLKQKSLTQALNSLKKKSSKTLFEQIKSCPLNSYVATDADLKRPVTLVCSSVDIPAAVKWFKERTKREPEYISAVDQQKKNKSAVKSLPFSKLKESLEILPVVFDNRKPRKKGIKLALLGIREFVYHTDPKFRSWRTDYNFYSENKERLEKLWEALADNESRLTLASIIKSRITGNAGYLRVAKYREYYHPKVKAEVGEVVADCGSFEGTTSVNFAKQVGKKGLVYAFEPCPKNVDRIKNNIKLNGCKNIEIVDKAIYSKTDKLRFKSGSGGSSKIVGEGADFLEVNAISMDDFAAQRDDFKMDLISIDIEGAEPDAILGADKVIRKFRPKLQISIYHYKNHLFDIPLDFLSKYPDYDLYIGHHDVYTTETDAYLIPKEKNKKKAKLARLFTL